MELIVAFGCVVVFFGWIGVLMIRRGLRESKRPPIPPARIANAEGAESAYAKVADVADQTPRKLGKGLLVTLGLGFIAAPWIVLAGIIHSLSNLDMTKGRVLRIRNRARLPELARGDGWSPAEVTLRDDVPAHERKLIGELWLLTARMEHASIAAFSQLSLHLSALGAPARLLAATHRAALDEIRHAEACFAVARALTGEPHTAGPIEALGSERAGSIDLTRLAIGSLVDGCIGEGIASDVASRSARDVAEPTLRATLEMIGREEATHAELAWDVLAWCLERGDVSLHRAVAARVEALATEMTPRLPDLRGADPQVLARFGVIDQDTIGALATARIAAVQTRARALLAREDAALAA
ncbi:MAG TPA: ferritin-like domain-containing protein [Kofleriaceae bacterium]